MDNPANSCVTGGIDAQQLQREPAPNLGKQRLQQPSDLWHNHVLVDVSAAPASLHHRALVPLDPLSRPAGLLPRLSHRGQAVGQGTRRAATFLPVPPTRGSSQLRRLAAFRSSGGRLVSHTTFPARIPRPLCHQPACPSTIVKHCGYGRKLVSCTYSRRCLTSVHSEGGMRTASSTRPRQTTSNTGLRRCGGVCPRTSV